MGFEVDFIGLAYFSAVLGADKRWVLLPDGRKPGNGIESHYARFVLSADPIRSDWWPPVTSSGGEVEYRIMKPSKITIASASPQSGALDVSAHDGQLPKMSARPSWDLDTESPDTIAQLTLTQGKLEAVSYLGAVCTRWTDSGSGEVTITSVSEDGTKTLTLAADTEIALLNTSDLSAHDPKTPSHFRIYWRLSKTGDGANESDPHVPSGVPALDVDDHPLLRGIQERYVNAQKGRGTVHMMIPLPGCSNTCCP